MRNAVQALLLALSLAACAISPGLPPPPPPSAPPAWVAPLPAAADAPAVAAGLPNWWRAFDDPAMHAVVEAALVASPTLAVAAARIERSRASRVAAAAALMPRVDASAIAQQGRSAVAAPSAFNAQLGVQAAWEIDLFGGRSADVRAAQARLASAQAQAQGTRVAVAAEAGTAMISLRACQLLVQVAREDAASREATAQLTALTSRAGLSAPADAALASAGAAQARSLVVAQQAACDATVKSLVELTAWSEEALRVRVATRAGMAPPGTVPQPAGVNVTMLPAALLEQRPDLIDTAAAVQAAAADEDSAVAAQLPQLALSGSIGAATSRSLGVAQSGSVWTLGPLQLTLPLFDAGARRANVSAARAEYQAAVAQYQGQLRRAVREVEQSLVALDGTARRDNDTALAAQGFDAALRATESRHRAGLASQFELEDARRNAFSTRRAVIQLQQERAIAWIDLLRALGGGWPAPDIATASRP